MLEGKGYIHATYQDMSKFDSNREAGYKRVTDVIEDFVLDGRIWLSQNKAPLRRRETAPSDQAAAGVG